MPVARMTPALTRIAAGLFIVALPIALITSNVRFLAGEVRLYEYAFRTYDADEVTGLPMAELDRAAREIIDYFENDQGTLRILVQVNGEEVSLFNARETAHMEDVKGLMRVVFRLNEVAIAYVLTYVTAVFVWSRQPVRKLALQSLAGVGVGFAVVAAVGAVALTGFDAAWDRFHRIAFRNDLWQLDPDSDRLIQMFPEPFWQDATYLLGLMTVAEAIVMVVVSLGYLVVAREGRRGQPEAAPQPAAPAEVQAVADRR